MVTENNSTQSNVAEPKEQSQEKQSAEPTEIVTPVKDEQKSDEPLKGEPVKVEDNKTLSALESQIVDGKNLAELEETAAGGGKAEREGVSLSAAAFAESGHESSIHADYKAISELSHNFETPISSVRGAMAEASAPVAFIHQSEQPFVGDPLKFKITMDNESSKEGNSDYIIYSLKAENVPANFGTTGLKLAFGGQATAGKDYSTVEYSLDGTTWNSVDADMIIKDVAFTAGASEVKIRVKTIDDYGLDEGNQNEGDKVENYDRTEMDHHITAGKYEESLTLSVSSTDGKLESASADGHIIDNDDYVTVSSSIPVVRDEYPGYDSSNNGANLGSNVAEKNKTIDTGDGEDKVSLNEGELSYLTINTGSGDDIVEIQNNSHLLMHHTTINTGVGDDIISFAHRAVNSETPVELLSDQGIFYNNIIDGGDGIDTLKLSCEYEPNQPLTSYKNIEVVDITNSPQYHAMDWYINGEVKKVVSKYGMNINIDDYNGITNKNGVGNLVDLIDRFNDSTHELFLKSDVEGHKLLLQGMNPWFFQKSNEQNVSELLDSMGVKMTKGEDTYKLDFDHNDSHYALTVSNTISLIFVEPIVDHL